MNRNLFIGNGFYEGDVPFKRGMLAARAALLQAGECPPAFALVNGGETDEAPELLRGVQAVLGDCPILGFPARMPFLSEVLPRVALKRRVARVVLVASPHMRVKVGTAQSAEENWDREIGEAFENAYFSGPRPQRDDSNAEDEMFDWYLYRRPSLVIAAVLSSPADRKAREQRVSSFLQKKLRGGIPFFTYTCAPPNNPMVYADGEVVRKGVVVVMIKTDLRFQVGRFHNYEPSGERLFATRSEGRKVLEFNGRPALKEYCSAFGMTEPETRKSRTRLFSTVPIAYRGRDGRYHLFLPERVDDDGAIVLPTEPQPDYPMYPMAPISSSETGITLGGESDDDLLKLSRGGCTLVLRNTDLRDAPLYMHSEGEMADRHPGIMHLWFDRGLRSFLPAEDWEGEASHLALTFPGDLDPMAVVAQENERLLLEVVRLKTLNQKIFDGIGYGIAVLNADKRIVHINNTYREMMGMSDGEILGAQCRWAGRAAGGCSRCVVEESVRQKSFTSQEVVREHNGNMATIRIDCFPLLDPGGEVESVVEVIRDVSAIKRLQVSLEQEKKKTEAVIEGMAESIYIVDRNYHLQFFHPGILPLSLGDDSGIADRKCHEFLFGRDFPCPWCRLSKTFRTGDVVRQVAHIPGKGNESRYFQLTFSSLEYLEGDPTAGICLVVDITSQHRMEQQMIHAEKLSSLSVLSAGMAHELNNPLGAINFNLEVLKRRQADREYSEILTSIQTDVNRINSIVQNLLSFSRRGARSYEPIDFQEVLDAVLELFRVVAEKKKVKIARELSPGLPKIFGNFQDLQQVFINLLSNAVDAMPTGGEVMVKAAPSLADEGQSTRTKVVVLYNHRENLDLLRAFQEVPELDIRYLRGEEEAYDHFSHPRLLSPDILLLDFVGATRDQLGRVLEMVRESSPLTRIIQIENAPSGEEPPSLPPVEVDDHLTRPVNTTRLLEAIQSLQLPSEDRLSENRGIMVTFSDTGIGMSPEQVNRIFDPFFTTKEGSQGTGLGLSVIHKILENHRATINVESRYGQGTTFVLHFPPCDYAGSGGEQVIHRDKGLKWKSALT